MLGIVLAWAVITAIVLIVCTRLLAAWRTANAIDAALDLDGDGIEPIREDA
jgi:hypothetical protein